jgi:arginine:agmatine antiporter
MGFQTNTIYWFANWIGNVALPVAAVGYFTYFVPALSDPLMRTIAILAIIWLFTFANILGPDVVTKIQSYTTSLALIPILGIAVFGWFFFSGSVFEGSYNVSGKSDFSAISAAASITLWAFIGVESASVTAGVVRDPQRNVPIATLAGVALAAVAYLLSSAAIIGMVPNDQLQTSDAPFALAARLAIGNTGGSVVSLCAAIGAAGSLGGWILLTAQSAKAAADDKLFPAIFGKSNARDVPISGLIIVAVLMSLMVLVTASSSSASAQFDVIVEVAVTLTLLPYIYSCVACYFAVEEEGKLHHIGLFWVLTSITVVYCLWAIFGSTPSIVQYSLIFILFITPFYPFFSERRRKLASLPVVAAVSSSTPAAPRT